MQDEMVNKDMMAKQEEKMQDLSNEIKITDESIQSEQLLNLELCNEYNALMTNLSHIINQRNSLLIECEGLKNTVLMLHAELQDIIHAVDEECENKCHVDEKVKMIEDKVTVKQELDQMHLHYEQGMSELFIVFHLWIVDC